MGGCIGDVTVPLYFISQGMDWEKVSVQIKFGIVCGLHCARILSTAHCARVALLKMLTFYGATCLFGNTLLTQFAELCFFVQTAKNSPRN